MKIGSILTAAVTALTSVCGAQTLDFLNTTPGAWTGYNNNPVPALNTTSPGSIADAAGGGASYGRSTDAAGAVSVSPLFRAGDVWSFQFDGILGNNSTFRIEFSNPTRTSALVFGLQNANPSGADFLQLDSLGTPGPSSLFSGNFGGAAGGTQRVFGNIDITIQSSTIAEVSGQMSDSTGIVWSTPFTMDLGNTAPTLYAAVNINSGGSVTTINTLTWTFTPVPEPGTWALVALGMLTFGLARKGITRT
jgi:hypothetical protein